MISEPVIPSASSPHTSGRTAEMKIAFISSAEIGDELLAEWLLEADESKRCEISLMRQADKRRLRIAADHLCRTAAAEALGLSPAEVKFGKNEHGKPITDGMEFNLSHSGDIAVCAVSDKPVGIDIEALREIRPDAAKRFASAEELEYIGSDPRRLFEIWTLKEAYFKCVGTGIGSDIKSVTFTVDGDDIRCSEPGFTCKFISIADGYICSVCEKES